VSLPAFMRPVAGSDTTSLRYLPMRVPHALRWAAEGDTSEAAAWPEKYGGRWYAPGPLGAGVTHFRSLMRNDTGLDVPMWADPEDPATLPVAVAAAEERYLMAPSWLMFGFYPRGSKGWWLPDPMAAGTVQQVRVRVACRLAVCTHSYHAMGLLYVCVIACESERRFDETPRRAWCTA
jgi:hypothetical protein